VKRREIFGIGLVGLVALVARTFNLPLVPFSLWLDEVLIVKRASGTFAEVIEACVRNAEHPPLVALLLALARSVTHSEKLLRLLPIACGVATVLLVAHWTARHWGRAAGLAAGFAAALWPFHVHYSQEIRPYSFLLCGAMAALVQAERLAEAPGWRRGLGLAAILSAGLYTHHLFALAVVPMAWPLLEAGVRRQWGARWGAALRWLLASWGVALLSFAPWAIVAGSRIAARDSAGGVQPWTLGRLAERWQFLTVGGVTGESLTWGGALLGVVVLAGIWLAARAVPGRAALAALLCGSVAVEVALVLGNRWSVGRYDAMAWPYLPVFFGVCFSALLRRRVVAVAVAGALAIAAIGGLARYASRARPDWTVVADAVWRARELAPDGVEIWAGSKFLARALEYYIAERAERAGEAIPPVAFLRHGGAELRALRQSGRPLLLVLERAAEPRNRGARRLAEFERPRVDLLYSGRREAQERQLRRAFGWRSDPEYRAQPWLRALGRLSGAAEPLGGEAPGGETPEGPQPD
jgi:hypothetical protein